MLFLFLSTWMNVDLNTHANELKARALDQWAGTLAMRVNGNEFPEASPVMPVYIRIRLDKGVKLAETLVDLITSPTRYEPISLAMSLKSTDDSQLIAPQDTAQIVRWLQGESEFWLRVQHTSSHWLEKSGVLQAPDLDHVVEWTMGRSIEEDRLVNEPLVPLGRANLPTNVQGSDAVHTHIIVDSSVSILTYKPPYRESNLDIIAMNYQTQGVRTAEHSTQIQLGDAASANFSGDDTLGIATDQGDFWLIPLDLRGYETVIQVPNSTGHSRPISIEMLADTGTPFAAVPLSINPGFNQLTNYNTNTAILIRESGELHIKLVLSNRFNQRFSIPAIRAVPERRFMLSVPARLSLFNPNKEDAAVKVNVFNDVGHLLSGSVLKLASHTRTHIEIPLLQRHQHLQVASAHPIVAGAVEVSGTEWLRVIPSKVVTRDVQGGLK